MAKIYRKRGNKLNEVVTFDSACTRQENQPLVYDATDGSVHTTTHIGCLDANDLSVNNLTVTGQAIIQEQVTDTINSNTLVLRSNADAGLTGTENSGVIIHNYNGSEDLYAVTDNTGTFRVGTAVSTTTTYAYLRYNKADNKWYSTAPGVTPVVEVTPVGSPTSWDSVVTSGDDVEYTNIVFSVIDRTSLQPLTTRDESTAMEKDYLTKWNSTDEKIITTGTSCTHDLCANGDITSTGDITADGNVCVKTNITVDGNSCVSGDSTVSGEIHSCKCITAPTACVSDDLYVAGDINNCNTDSIFHGSYGCFEKNVCIKGDLAIDGTIAVSSLTSDHVISVENTTNSTFYPSFVQNNHLVAGSNDLYTNGDLQYNPSTDVLCTKTFCSDRGIVQSAISGVTAADLGLTANTVYGLSTIVSCLQACCGNKAVSYSFEYKDASTPEVGEYSHRQAYNLTFEKLDNNDLSGTYTKSRWLVTGANGVSWTVTGTTGSTAGSITWTVCEHVVDQVCVATALTNNDFPLIFSNCQSTPSCSKKTLYTDSANQLMYNPSTNTLKTCCINANTSLSQGNLSYKYCFMKNGNSGRTTLIVLKDISCAVCCSSCSTSIIGRVCSNRSPTELASSAIVEDVNFYIKANYGVTGSSAMDIKYYGYGEDQLRPVIITRNDNKVYAAMCISGSARYLSFDTIGACSVINEVVDANGVYKDSSGHTYAITKAGDLATLCVNASSSNVWTADQNTNYPIVFSTCQKTPTIGCKTLYNDSANNLMYNPGTNTMSVPNVNASGTVCATSGFTSDGTSIIKAEFNNELNIYPKTGNIVHINYRGGANTIQVNKGNVTNDLGTVCAATFCGDFCGPLNGKATNLDASDAYPVGTCSARLWSSTHADSYGLCDNDWSHYLSISHGDYDTYYGLSMTLPFWDRSRFKWRVRENGNLCPVHELIDDRGGQTIAGNLTLHNSSSNATLTADCFKGNFCGCINFNDVADADMIIIDPNVCHVTRKVYYYTTFDHQGFYQRFALGMCRNFADTGWGAAILSVGVNDAGTAWQDYKFDANGYITAPSGYRTSTGLTLTSSTSTPISLTCGSYKVTVDSRNSIAVGKDANAGGTYSVAISTNANAGGTYSVAIGTNAKANSDDAIVIGNNACATVNGFAAVVIGNEACGLGVDAIAIGDNACSCENAVAIGIEAYAVENSTAIGYSARTGGHGFLALGKCANSYVCQNVSDIYFRFPFSTTIEIDDPLYGRHGHIKFVIPSCSQKRDITNFLNCLFVREINNGRCKCTWSASSCCNVPTLVAHLSGFYWDDGGSSNRYQRWAPGINGRGNINELILLNTSSGASSNLSVYDLIVTCGKNICTTSWNWGTGTSIWTCGMVGTIEF